MKKLLLIVSAMTMGIAAALAVPAKPGVKKILTLADGTRVEATLTGDEHVNYYRTSDNLAIQMIDGAYRYVNLDSLNRLHSKRLAARNAERALRLPAGPTEPIVGKRRGLVILVQFKDVKFTYGLEEFKDYFNKSGYDRDGMQGSVRDYFLEQSYGKLDFEFDVVGPITVTYNAEYYAADNSRVAAMVNTVCKKVDDDVDFSLYDADDDKSVDQVVIIYAGYGAAQGAENTIWPHEWNAKYASGGNAYRTRDGVSIAVYCVSCELMGNGKTDKGHIDGVGTSCHEFSHSLGLPDFYDTGHNDGTSAGAFGMGAWDLMCSGCYNGDSNGRCPSAYTAYERWFAGWLEPTELKSGCQVENMPSLVDSPVAYVIYNEKTSTEYYLLQNIQQKGFDTAQPGHGMLVMHVDYDEEAWNYNSVNRDASHQRMTIIPADNELYTTITSFAADPFPGTRRKTQLTDTSRPAATLYNANSDGRKFMGKPITNIKEKNGLISFTFMGGGEVIDGIQALPSKSAEGYVYGIDGRRFSYDRLAHGLYIRNGRKFIAK